MLATGDDFRCRSSNTAAIWHNGAGCRRQHIDHYVWDLSSLYPGRAAWEAERSTIDSKLKVIGKLRGTLSRDPKSLADGLDQVSDPAKKEWTMAGRARDGQRWLRTPSQPDDGGPKSLQLQPRAISLS
jgi:hypothetical protein